MSLSVCLIVKNEENVIARCLACVKKFADEIVVVDTGSADRTVEEVKKFTDNIYFFKWIDDFSAARNFSLDKACGDYVMWLDADDVITDENCRKIKKLLNGTDFDMAFLPYAATAEDGAPNFIYYRERIFKRNKNFRFSGAVHEAVSPQGKVIYGDATILHNKVKESEPLRNLRILQKQIARGICLNEREKFYYGRELFYNRMYRESIAVLEDFLCGNGWVENKIEACLNLYRAYVIIGDEKAALNALLRSFLYAPPRSEACCILGAYFLEQNDVSCAIYWYQSALECENDLRSGAFVNIDFCGFIPYIQLCVLYDRLGETGKANFYNEKAGEIKPNDKSYLSNKKYFQSKIVCKP